MISLNIGCGRTPSPGLVNCDLYPGPGVDYAFDCTKRWPFEDNVAKLIVSFHMLEHLDDPRGFFAEAWRVLAPDGQLFLQLPYGASSAGITDIEHKRYWMPGSFAFLQPGYGEMVRNPQHEEWAFPFMVGNVGVRIPPNMRPLLYWPWRSLGLQLLNHLWDGYCELAALMIPLKTPEAVEGFRKIRPGNMVPVTPYMNGEDWDGQKQVKEFPIMYYQNVHNGSKEKK